MVTSVDNIGDGNIGCTSTSGTGFPVLAWQVVSTASPGLTFSTRLSSWSSCQLQRIISRLVKEYNNNINCKEWFEGAAYHGLGNAIDKQLQSRRGRSNKADWNLCKINQNKSMVKLCKTLIDRQQVCLSFNNILRKFPPVFVCVFVFVFVCVIVKGIKFAQIYNRYGRLEGRVLLFWIQATRQIQ